MKHSLPIKNIIHLKLNMIVDFFTPLIHIFKLLIKIKKVVFWNKLLVPSPCSNLETMASRLGNT
jgi:hypothetical protein